jgi:ferric-dicitrate binding protein FerR (iron transport regulator)
MSIQEELQYLLTQYLEDRLTPGERTRLLALFRKEDHRQLLADSIEVLLSRPVLEDGQGLTADKQKLFQQVLDEAEVRLAGVRSAEDRSAGTRPAAFGSTVVTMGVRSREWRRRISYAAAVLLVLAGTWWFIGNRNAGRQLAERATGKRSMLPVRHGINQVMLTLADGSQVPLDTVKEGLLDGAKRAQRGAEIFKTGQGEIIYKPTVLSGGNAPSSDGSAPLVYNTITTPRGGQYHIVLPDNTQVWLNAASSLRFPVAFSGKERDVVLSGEGYFEVAKDVSKPFTVLLASAAGGGKGAGAKGDGGVRGKDGAGDGGMKVNVLGTHFNIMAYSDENSVKTTLLEGAVRLTSHAGKMLLKPGQQGSLPHNSDEFQLSVPDIGSVIAWKNGEFRFDNTPVSAIMRQIERWYDLSVGYEGDMKDIVLSGVISRKQDVTQLLDILEATHKIQFRIENERLIVMPYEKK